MAGINPLLTQESLAVHMFDGGDDVPVSVYGPDQGRQVNHMRTDKYLIDPAERPAKIVDRVLKPIGPKQQIHIMRMVSHGDSGVFDFPGMYNVNAISLEYRRFRNYFDPQARLELHGCGIASQTSIVKPGLTYRNPKQSDLVPGTFYGDSKGRGLVYLRRVAVVFGVQVVGGVNFQRVHANQWEFEGDTVTVFPDGKFHYDSMSTRPWDLGARQTAAMNWLKHIENTMIDKGLLGEARPSLQELIQKYPQTIAARRAETKLLRRDLKEPALQPDP